MASVVLLPEPFVIDVGLPGGLFAVLASRARGREFIETSGIQDPAEIVAMSLSKTLEERLLITTTGFSTANIDTNDVNELLRNSPDSDLILAIKTVGWSINPYVSSGGGFRHLYRAQIRMIDSKSRQLVAQGYCDTWTRKKPAFGTIEELLADGGNNIKNELKSESEFCANQLTMQILPELK